MLFLTVFFFLVRIHISAPYREQTFFSKTLHFFKILKFFPKRPKRHQSPNFPPKLRKDLFSGIIGLIVDLFDIGGSGASE